MVEVGEGGGTEVSSRGGEVVGAVVVVEQVADRSAGQFSCRVVGAQVNSAINLNCKHALLCTPQPPTFSEKQKV